MLFLWTEHHRKLLDMSPVKQSETWFEWMNLGALHYDLQQWQEAIPYLGCAFDLSCQLLCRHRYKMSEQELKSTATQLTLSAIYLTNAFQHFGNRDKARFILAKALRILHQDKQQVNLQAGWAQECVQALVNQERHEDFFERYLNLPFASSHPHMEAHFH